MKNSTILVVLFFICSANLHLSCNPIIVNLYCLKNYIILLPKPLVWTMHRFKSVVCDRILKKLHRWSIRLIFTTNHLHSQINNSLIWDTKQDVWRLPAFFSASLGDIVGNVRNYSRKFPICFDWILIKGYKNSSAKYLE